MRRDEIDIVIEPGGVVQVNVRGMDPHLCSQYKHFFAHVLQAATEEEFEQLRLPATVEEAEELHRRIHARTRG
jgi:hypothetical protein